MKHWALYTTNNADKTTTRRILFNDPYDANNWLRELSYTYQNLGAKTEMSGTIGEPTMKVSTSGDELIAIYTLVEQS